MSQMSDEALLCVAKQHLEEMPTSCSLDGAYYMLLLLWQSVIKRPAIGAIGPAEHSEDGRVA